MGDPPHPHVGVREAPLPQMRGANRGAPAEAEDTNRHRSAPVDGGARYAQVTGPDAAGRETDPLAGPVAQSFAPGPSGGHIRFAANPDWPAASPASQGFDAAKLDELWAGQAHRGTHGWLVIRHDRVVFERHTAEYGRAKPHGTASLAKALVGGASLMLAMDKGRVNPDDLASRFVPSWANDPLRSKITIRHLATHTSGIEEAEADDLPMSN